MKKINTTPISGMQELLPGMQAEFDRLKEVIATKYREQGFLHIETPVIDRCEVLLAKAGGDTEKQIYKVVKTAEAAEGADQALRFDHTVPLARYVVEHEGALAFPFKTYQIGRNFRGERAQKGRYREFYQCDVDIIGRGVLGVEYDVQVISALLETLRAFRLGTPVVARVSNRKIVAGLIASMNLEEKSEAIFSIIDHAEKVTAERTEVACYEIGLSEAGAARLMEFIGIRGQRGEVVGHLSGMGISNEMFLSGVRELDESLRFLERLGYGDEVMADMGIVRGLDYYTGVVFEFALPEYPGIGSIGGGGRYENLTGHFTDQVFPGVGGSIGLTRLFGALVENGLITAEERPVEIAVVPVTEKEFIGAEQIAAKLRGENPGVGVTVVLGNKKLGDKMKYAAKIARKVVVVGETEVASGEFEIRELR